MFLFIAIGLWIYYNNYKKREQLDFTHLSKVKKVAIITAVLAGLSMATGGIFDFLFYVLMILGFAVSPAIVIYLIARNSKIKRRENETSEEYVNRTPRKLDKSPKIRRNIIRKFNEIYELRLTDEQIDCIVDASYASAPWDNEVAYMQQQYNSVAEWLSAPTGWLRAYLRAFCVQEVSSDFKYQRQICISAFNQIFKEINLEKYYSLTEAIEDVNRKYLTEFDHLTFMIAYRFLEANGYKYNLPGANVVMNEDEAEKLAKEYERMERMTGQ